MGLIVSWQLLELAPKLIEAIKTAGLVLISDMSNKGEGDDDDENVPMGFGGPNLHVTPEGIDGTLRRNAVLRFNDSVDM
jgi:CDK inhibitor PHO81